MKSFKRALLISLILHIVLLGLLSLRFPERKKPSPVRVRLVSISQAGPHTLSPRVPSRKATKPTSPPKKQTSSPPKIRTSKPKKKPQREKSRPQPRARKTKVSKPKPSPGKKGSVSSPSKVTPREEERLRERLAALQLKQKLEKLQAKVASEKRAGEGGGGSTSRNYPDLIRARLHEFFEVPLSLKSRKNLTAIVEIRLGASGRLLSYRLIKSSGNTLLDRVAEAAVRAADPYPPPGKPVTIKAIFTPEGFKQLVDF